MPDLPAPPALPAPVLPPFAPDDPKTVLKAFADAPEVAMQQTFLPLPEPDFLAATVRVGWNSEGAWVWASIPDPDIVTEATEDGQPLWTLGDVFEIFLRPDGQDAYYEFHVAPTGHRLALRFPTEETIREMRRNPKPEGTAAQDLAADIELVRAWVWEDKKVVDQRVETWNVLACVSPKISEKSGGVILSGDTWRFSFSRYDYQTTRDEPLVSSTSPHQEANFHDQTAWGTLTFTGDPNATPPKPTRAKAAK